MKQSLDAGYWNSVAEEVNNNRILEKNIANYYSSEHIRLIKKWSNDGLTGKKILKTDLYEEAFRDGDFVFWLLGQNSKVFGMDIAYKIAEKARIYAKELNLSFETCITADIRNCAFKDDSFDLIISNSTLDNLRPQDLPKALFELRRILKPKGVLILTLDNADNPLYLSGYTIEKFLNTNKHYQARCYSLGKAKYMAEQNNFIIQDIDAIVHIPTPFNKLAILLEKTGIKLLDKLVRASICLFSKMGNKRTKFLTGWFIALKLVKNDD